VKRVLLTAYADTDAAIRAINDVRLNHYLLKPWDPPESNLYPVVDDLLTDWQENYRPSFEGIRVLGSRWSPQAYELRDFLARNHIPYRWLDVEAADREPEVRTYLDKIGVDTQLPAVVFPDGSKLFQPSPTEVAGHLGVRTVPHEKFYDVIIVGGGPAGLAAAVYGASEGLRSVIVEREAPGGQAGLSSKIENYLGFPLGLTGSDLAKRAVAQARRFGAEIVSPQEVKGFRVEGPYRFVTLSDGTEFSGHTMVVATGVQWRRLNIPGMDRLTGAGVYYGASATEAASCKNETVYIVGGANSAGQAAMNFARHEARVIILVRGEGLSSTMSQYLVDQIGKEPCIEVRPFTEVVEVHGEERLESISIKCRQTNTVEQVPTNSIFIFIGAEPRTEWLAPTVERDERGFILTGVDLMKNGKRPAGWTLDRDPGLLETNVPGVFSVGDVRHGSVKRVASGVGEGSIVVQFIHQYLAVV
jgi:thioredoxin reductase (NADPH)